MHEDEKQILFSFFFQKKKLFADESQCGNYMIILSLRFYENSILRILEAQKLPFLTFYVLMILFFGKCQPSKG